MSRMRLFRCTLLLIVLLAACCSTASALAAVEAQQVYSSNGPLLFAVGGDGVWLYRQNELLWFGDGDREPQDILHRNDVICLASDTLASQGFYLTRAADGTRSLHAVTSGGTVVLDAVPLGESVSDIILSGGLWALGESGSICSVYTGDGSMSVISTSGWDNSDVTTFAAYQNQLLAYKAQTGELVLIDTITDTVIASVSVPNLCNVQIGRLKDGAPTALALRETDAGHELVMIRMDSGEVEVLDTNLPADCNGLKRNDQTLYTLGNAGTTLFALSLRELYGESDKPTLTLVNERSSADRLPVAIDLFHEKYPDVEVIQREIDDPWVITTEMMAGSPDIDLIGIQDSYMPISAAMLLRSGALLDFDQFEELTALKEHYRDIFGMVTIGGHWYAAPVDLMDMHLWQVNPRLARELGWEPPEGRWTWDDFRALVERVKAYNATAEKPMYLLQEDNVLPYFLMEYQANHVDAYAGVADYTSETYLDLLRLWKDLNDSGLIYDPPITSNPTIGFNVLLYSKRTSRIATGSLPHILPPTETEDSLYPVYIAGVLALNANSQHLEEAVYFLSCYMSVEATSNMLYCNGGMWLKDGERVESYEKVSDENDALWNYLLEHGAPELYLYDILRQQRNTLLPGLLDGTVTPEQFAQISQQLADMMLGE